MSVSKKLTAIADNIRTHCNIDEKMSIKEMVQKINEEETQVRLLSGRLITRDYTMITIPDGTTKIGDYAFYYHERLKDVTIPGSVKTIGDEAFARCRNLSEVTISEGVENIGKRAFRGCSTFLTVIRLPSSIKSIGDGAFSVCNWLYAIYCGFAEGAVSGAPWGATDAEIHYNYNPDNQ